MTSTHDNRLTQVLEIHHRVSQERSMERLPALVMETVGKLMNADRSTLFLFDTETMALRACFAQGMESSKAIVVPLKIGLLGTALLQRRTLNLINVSQHPFFNPEIDSPSGCQVDSLLIMPITREHDGQVLGGLTLINKPSGRFTIDDERIAADAAHRFAELIDDATVDAATVSNRLQGLHKWLEFEHGGVFRLDSLQGQLAAVHIEGVADQHVSLNLHLGIAGVVTLTGEPLLIADAHADPRFDASFDRKTGYLTRQILCVPLKDSNGETLGVIQVINKRSGQFDTEDLALLMSVAGIVAIALENAMHYDEDMQQFRSILDALAASIDARDALTAGHSRRVAQISRGIAEQLEFTWQDIDLLEVAAILHDYGKIGVDDAVLKKEGRLDDDEYKHMKHHAHLSFDILDRIRFSRKYRSVPLIASSHHECLDGSGYPRGLKAHEIPFMAKILSVADVFEALTADRHYRKGMSIAQTLEIIDAGAGQKFEPRVIDALRAYLVNGVEELGLRVN